MQVKAADHGLITKFRRWACPTAGSAVMLPFTLRYLPLPPLITSVNRFASKLNEPAPITVPRAQLIAHVAKGILVEVVLTGEHSGPDIRLQV